MKGNNKNPVTIGVLALQGDVIEHFSALEKAAQKLKQKVVTRLVRTKEDLKGLNGLIIPGGESTTLQKLLEREGMFDAVKSVPAIFGTCAGAILLSNKVEDAAEGQRTLGLMDIAVKRNAYGTQQSSFEERIKTELGNIHAVFIRAPHMTKVGKSVKILAQSKNEILTCEVVSKEKYYLATTFHPELTTVLLHKHFLKNI